jgi:hypothetical protein
MMTRGTMRMLSCPIISDRLKTPSGKSKSSVEVMEAAITLTKRYIPRDSGTKEHSTVALVTSWFQFVPLLHLD